jgi:hypothetical protein
MLLDEPDVVCESIGHVRIQPLQQLLDPRQKEDRVLDQAKGIAAADKHNPPSRFVRSCVHRQRSCPTGPGLYCCGMVVQVGFEAQGCAGMILA